ncbi:MAG: PepSY domain-containing protein [candidate division WOR-3 bacterium]
MKKFRQLDSKLRMRWDHKLKASAFISRKIAEPFEGKPERMIIGAALEFLDENKSLLRMKDPKEELKLIKKVRDSKGNTCVVMQQMHNGIPVEGGIARVQFDPNRAINLLTNKYQPEIEIDTKPKIEVEDAIQIALKDAKDGKPEEGYSPKLCIYQRKDKTYLAYNVHIDDLEHERELHYYIDTHNGKIIHKNALRNIGSGVGVYSGSGSLSTVLDGTIYKLIHNIRMSSGGPEIRTCDLDGTTNNCSDANISEDSDNNWN